MWLPRGPSNIPFRDLESWESLIKEKRKSSWTKRGSQLEHICYNYSPITPLPLLGAAQVLSPLEYLTSDYITVFYFAYFKKTLSKTLWMFATQKLRMMTFSYFNIFYYGDCLQNEVSIPLRLSQLYSPTLPETFTQTN